MKINYTKCYVFSCVSSINMVIRGQQLVCWRAHVLFTLFGFCLGIVVSNTYCVVYLFLFVIVVLLVSLDCLSCIAPSVFSNVYLFCLSSSCVPYVASFSGLSIFYCLFGYSLTFIYIISKNATCNC